MAEVIWTYSAYEDFRIYCKRFGTLCFTNSKKNLEGNQTNRTQSKSSKESSGSWVS